jgi:hypothetical protein
LYFFISRFKLKLTSNPKGRPSEGRRHSKFNNASQQKKLKKEEIIIPSGIPWKTSNVLNSCTIDNHLTALKIKTLEDENFLEKFGNSPSENELKKVIELLHQDQPEEAKYLWANYTSGFKNLPTYDLYGSPNEHMFDHLKSSFSFHSIAKCINCSEESNEPFTYIPIDLSQDVSKSFKGFLTNSRILPSCCSCNCPTLQHFGTKLFSRSS